jgi:hypothetical protein
MFSALDVYADPAAVFEGGICHGPVYNSDNQLLGIYPGTSKKVITDDGTRILTCKFDHYEDLLQATGAEGFVCGISDPDHPEEFPVLATESKTVATPSGKATMVCKFAPEDLYS